MTRKTCGKCVHFSPDLNHTGFGSCALMDDMNRYTENELEIDHAYGWDYEGYMAGVTVGENFGCIHWEKAA